MSYPRAAWRQTTALILTGLALSSFAAESPAKNANGGSAASGSRSIREWVKCDGASDDAVGAATAFAAAKGNAFALVVDCPVFIHIGNDVARPIFIDNDTTVRFEGAGLFITDNISIPTWVLANTHNVQLRNWRVQYKGSMPVTYLRDGYQRDGKFVALKGNVPESFAFTQQTLKSWYSKNRGVTFLNNSNPPWVGPTSTAAMFYFAGSTHDVVIDDMKLFVAKDAGGHQFIPTCFATAIGYKDSQTVSNNPAPNLQNASIPSKFRVSNLDIDGAYMGWTGGLTHSVFERIRSHRYGDLQDAAGGTNGGENKWFAPPHLLYFGRFSGFDNEDLTIEDVVDYGERVGVARDTSMQGISGNAASLKISGVDSVVRNYTTNRPDGALDLLYSKNLKIIDFRGTYDSSFMNNLFTGVRFPVDGYENVTFQNMSLTDTATTTRISPFFGLLRRVNQNSGIVFDNVSATVNKWSGDGNIGSGLGSDIYGVRVTYKELNP